MCSLSSFQVEQSGPLSTPSASGGNLLPLPIQLLDRFDQLWVFQLETEPTHRAFSSGWSSPSGSGVMLRPHMRPLGL